MRLAVVAYPQLGPEAAAAIDSFRAHHDPQAYRIAAHVTLVFPVEADAAAVVAEVREMAASAEPVEFTLARVDDSIGIDGRSYVMLEPTEGRERIEALHDRLYAGVLGGALRRDVEYVPHVTVAVSEDPDAGATLAGDLRATWEPAVGRIVELTLLDLDADPYRAVEVCRLGPVSAAGATCAEVAAS